MTYACLPVVVGGQNCVSCPEVIAVPGVPQSIITDPQYGWNSSAYSAVQRTGDCYVQFNTPNVIGVVLGLGTERISNDPRDIPHGFYIYESSGQRLYRVVESGIPITTPGAHVFDTTTYRIERRSGVVRYFVNNTQIYTSAIPSPAPLRVIVCMYAAGDGVN